MSARVFKCTRLCLCVWLCMCVSAFACLRVCLRIYILACVCVCVCVLVCDNTGDHACVLPQEASTLALISHCCSGYPVGPLMSRVQAGCGVWGAHQHPPGPGKKTRADGSPGEGNIKNNSS